MSNDKICTIRLTEHELNELETLIGTKYGIKDGLETSTMLKTILLSQTQKIDFTNEINDVIKRISELNKGTEFTLSDLFSKSEWTKKDSYKKVLGKLFKAKSSEIEWIEAIESKSSQRVQKYKKIK